MPTNDKIKPIVIKAIVQAKSPEAERSLAWTTIESLTKRLSQLDADIRFAETQKQQVRQLRSNLLDNFPEAEDTQEAE